VVDLLGDAGLARGTTMMGIFSTGKNRISVESGYEDGVVEPLLVPGFQNGPLIEAGGGPGRLSYDAETWTLAYSRTQWPAPFTAILSLEPALANISGTVTCADGIGRGVNPIDGVLRIPDLSSDECDLLLYTPSGEHTERIRPGSRLRCRTVSNADEDVVTCS